MNRHHENVGYALVTLRLKVVFGHPEGIVAQPVHQLSDVLGLVKSRDQVVIGENTVVHGSTAVAYIVHVHVPGEQAVEFGNHVAASIM